MRTNKNIRSVAAVLLALLMMLSSLGALAASPASSSKVRVGISLDQSAIALSPGRSVVLTANTELPKDSEAAVSWSSSDASIATVDDTGRVRAKALGNCVITATLGSAKVFCEVEVTLDPARYDGPEKSTSLRVGYLDGSGNAAPSTPGEVTVYLTRHGKTMMNTSDRVQGWADSPLTAAGREVAQYLGLGLQSEGVKFIKAYSSDSGRAIETVDIVLENSGQPDLSRAQDAGLREWNYGDFEGGPNAVMAEAALKALNLEKFEDLWTVPLEAQCTAIMSNAGDTSEDWDTIYKRTTEAFDRVVQDALKEGGGNILVVSHGSAIQTIISSMAPDKVEHLSNAAVCKITYKDGKYTVHTVNDLSYVEKGQAAAHPVVRGEVTIYLTRHGKTFFNTVQRAQGWSDTPLTVAGREVAEYLGIGLQAEGVVFDSAYSSDSGRARETAQIALTSSGQPDVPHYINKDIREWNFGGFEGALDDEMWGAAIEAGKLPSMEEMMAAGFDKDMLEKCANAISLADETGVAEDWDAVYARTNRGFEDIVAEAATRGDKTILVVSHGLTIDSILAKHAPDRIEQMHNAAVCKIVYRNGKYTVLTSNDLSFVEAGERIAKKSQANSDKAA